MKYNSKSKRKGKLAYAILIKNTLIVKFNVEVWKIPLSSFK